MVGRSSSNTLPTSQSSVPLGASQQPSGSTSTAADWSAIGTLEQRLQKQHHEGAEWELVVETMKVILLKLKNISISGSNGHNEVTEWMNGNSVFV